MLCEQPCWPFWAEISKISSYFSFSDSLRLSLKALLIGKKSHLGLICFSYSGLGKTWIHTYNFLLFLLYTCVGMSQDLWSLSFLKKKNHFIPSQHYDLHVHSSNISKGGRKSRPQKHQRFLIENWSLTRVDCGEGNIWSNKSCVFILLLPESQNQSWNFAALALFVPPSHFTQMVLV